MDLGQVEYREYQPRPVLQPYVECFWSRVSGLPAGSRSSATPDSHLVLPDGCIDIIFDFSDYAVEGELSQGADPVAGAFAVGTMTHPLLVRSAGRLRFVGVRFKPGQSHRFLGIPASEVTNLRVGLEDLWSAEAKDLAERLSELGEPHLQVLELQEHLERMLRIRDLPDDRYITAIISQVTARRGEISVEQLARTAGITRQHLGRKFDYYVGVSPKLFIRLIRFRSLIEQAALVGVKDLSLVALDHGYYDQAHMTHDFREFSGVSPARYFSGRKVYPPDHVLS
jgi:AraC-like DNA-binding protein